MVSGSAMSVLSVQAQQPFTMLACAVAAASGIALYYYCNNEQESTSVIDPGRTYGVRSSTSARNVVPTWSSQVQRVSTDTNVTAVPASDRRWSQDTSRSRFTSRLSTGEPPQQQWSHQSSNENRTSSNVSTGVQPTWLTSRCANQGVPSVDTTSSGTRVQTLQTGGGSTGTTNTAVLPSSCNEVAQGNQGNRNVTVYTKRSYERNVQRTTSSTDPSKMDDVSTAQSVRLIPITMDNPQVHKIQRSVDTQVVDGKFVKTERKNEQMMRESIRQGVTAVSK